MRNVDGTAFHHEGWGFLVVPLFFVPDVDVVIEQRGRIEQQQQSGLLHPIAAM